jgi:DNA-binding response OmpR family regulator
MARVVFAGIEESIANNLIAVLGPAGHQISHSPISAPVDEFLRADIIFATGESGKYMTLLRLVRRLRPALPFVVVTRSPETFAWLEALEAGATDCCSPPFEPRQIALLMNSALPRVLRATH